MILGMTPPTFGMAQGRPKLREKGAADLGQQRRKIIDLQPQILFGVSNFDRQLIINNNLVLAKAAKVFGVPVVLSTVEINAFSGNMWPEIQAVFPKREPKLCSQKRTREAPRLRGAGAQSGQALGHGGNSGRRLKSQCLPDPAGLTGTSASPMDQF